MSLNPNLSCKFQNAEEENPLSYSCLFGSHAGFQAQIGLHPKSAWAATLRGKNVATRGPKNRGTDPEASGHL